MIADLTTILWKEFRELVSHRPNLRGGWLGLLLLLVVFGIFLPLQMGAGWVNNPINLFFWSWVPFLLVSGVVADSIAGERERHTLETLLATRLPDRAILFGKIAAAVVYGWGITLASVLVGLISINIAFGHGRLILYSPSMGLAIFSLSFLISLLSASLGVLISLRASTVRQAQQTLSYAMFAILIPLLALPLLPESWRQSFELFLMGANIDLIVEILVVILAVIDVLLILAGMARFQRKRLILD